MRCVRYLLAAWCVVLAAEPVCAQSDELRCLDDLFSSAGPWIGEARTQRILNARREAKQEPLATDRPDITETSSVVGLGIVVMESGYTFFYRDDERDGSISRTHTTPEFLWRIGFHEGAELRIVWTYQWDEITAGGARSTPNGGNDLDIGFKFQLLRQDGWIPETAAITGISMPTGAQEFNTEDVQYELVFLFGWELADDWELGINSGFGTETEDVMLGPGAIDRDGYVRFIQTIAISRPITESLGFYSEYVGLYTVGRRENFPENLVAAGFTYLFCKDVQFDVRGGKGLNDHADDFFSGVGLSVRF